MGLDNYNVYDIMSPEDGKSDLLRMKEIAARPKDIRFLERYRDILEGDEEYPAAPG